MDSRKLQLCQAAATLIYSTVPAILFAHGHPAMVTVVEGKLTLEGNVADPTGLAREVLADTDGDAPLFSLGDGRLFTDFPGFDVSGMNPGEGLFLEPIAIPQPSGGDSRLLWCWSHAKMAVDVAPNEQTLDLYAADFTESHLALPQYGDAPGAMKILNPDAEDIGHHRHAVFFVLGNSPPEPTGAYGFFARLTSPAYDPSEMFLITLNNGLSAATFVDAAIAINEAALGLPGDYNGDGGVDASDYALWRDKLGGNVAMSGDATPGSVSAEDFLVWRQNYGATTATSAGEMAIPEPGSCGLIVWGVAMLSLRRTWVEK